MRNISWKSGNFVLQARGRLHKGLELSLFHRDCSIHLRPTPMPNFYTSKSFTKVGRHALRPAPKFMKLTPDVDTKMFEAYRKVLLKMTRLQDQKILPNCRCALCRPWRFQCLYLKSRAYKLYSASRYSLNFGNCGHDFNSVLNFCIFNKFSEEIILMWPASCTKK